MDNRLEIRIGTGAVRAAPSLYEDARLQIVSNRIVTDHRIYVDVAQPPGTTKDINPPAVGHNLIVLNECFIADNAIAGSGIQVDTCIVVNDTIVQNVGRSGQSTAQWITRVGQDIDTPVIIGEQAVLQGARQRSGAIVIGPEMMLPQSPMFLLAALEVK